MNFLPHHRFDGCRSIEACVERLRTAGTIPDPLYTAYQSYHYSLVHKLRSAHYHLESLTRYLGSEAAIAATPSELVYRVNFHFDGFLHLAGSAADIFAREVLTYFGIVLPAKVYFDTAERLIRNTRPGDPLVPVLTIPRWRVEFSEYRNTSTHERLIGKQYEMKIEVNGEVSTRRLLFPIPDDPRSHTPTCKRNPDIVIYCEKTFKRIVSHFNQVYCHLCPRIRTHGSLPL